MPGSVTGVFFPSRVHVTTRWQPASDTPVARFPRTHRRAASAVAMVAGSAPRSLPLRCRDASGACPDPRCLPSAGDPRRRMPISEHRSRNLVEPAVLRTTNTTDGFCSPATSLETPAGIPRLPLLSAQPYGTCDLARIFDRGLGPRTRYPPKTLGMRLLGPSPPTDFCRRKQRTGTPSSAPSSPAPESVEPLAEPAPSHALAYRSNRRVAPQT